MTQELVKRLRTPDLWLRIDAHGGQHIDGAPSEAATLIEHQQRVIEEAIEALEIIDYEANCLIEYGVEGAVYWRSTLESIKTRSRTSLQSIDTIMKRMGAAA